MCERLSQRESLIYRFATFSGEAINDNSMRLPFSRIPWTYFPNLKKNYNFFSLKITGLSGTQKDNRKWCSKHQEHHLFISQFSAYIQNSECHKNSIFKRQQNKKSKHSKTYQTQPTKCCTLTFHNKCGLLTPADAQAMAHCNNRSQFSQ